MPVAYGSMQGGKFVPTGLPTPEPSVTATGYSNVLTGQTLNNQPIYTSGAGTPPPANTSTPTVVTDANIRESTIPDITQRAGVALKNVGGVIQSAAPDGSTLSANGNYIDKAGNQYATPPAMTGNTSAPAASATKTTPPASGAAPTDTPAPTNEYDDFLKSIFDTNPSTTTDGAAPANDPYLTTLATMRATSDAASKTLIDSTMQQFASRKAQLAATQAAGHAGLMQTLVSNGEARYAPLLAGQTMTADETSGVLALSSIDAEESSAVAQLQKSQSDQDFQSMGKALDHLDSLRTEKVTVASKLADDAAAATKAINDAKQHVQDQKDAVIQELAKYAPPDIVAAATAAPDAAGAIAAGAGYFKDPTSDAGQYQAYVDAAKAKGLTPMTPGDFLAKQKANANYQAAYSTEAGKAAADNALGINPDGTTLTPDPQATGLTGAAGISLQAFNYLTQGTASMSRMPVAQRNAIMKEANDWLNKNGIDISTFQSQYKAANTTLQQNIERENNVNTRGGEVTSTVDSLIDAIKTDANAGDKTETNITGVGGMNSLRAQNVLDILAGNAVNNPFAETYSTQIGFLANDLAGYLAASRGATSPDDSDKRDAANMISKGMNTGSLDAFKTAVKNNVDKTAKVVSTQADSSKKQVWDLFGVGGQFKPPAPQVNTRDAVDTWVKSNPAQADMVAKAYEVPGATDQDVLDYIQLLDKAR